MERPIAEKAERLNQLVTPLVRFFFESTWAKRFGEPGICDFTIGNPHDTPLSAFVDALQRWLPPRDRYWYAYKTNEAAARETVAASLRASHGLSFNPADIFLTNGATAALAVAFSTILDPADEVIFISPPWFLYEAMILHAGGTPVRVKMDAAGFDLDLAAISSAITAKTRAVIVNSPHNPTGKIYPADTLRELAGILGAASRRNGRTIYLISDEAYRRILFDGRAYFSPAGFYPHTFLVYTYGKTLLAPGQRIGYLALAPGMEAAERLRNVIQTVQMINGWSFPNALLQHALGDLEQISIDISHLQHKRDRLVGALRRQGYQASMPEGTFYLLVRSPWADDAAYVDLLNDYGIFCIPGFLMDLPGYFRLSLTASEEMIDRAIPAFAATLARAS